MRATRRAPPQPHTPRREFTAEEARAIAQTAATDGWQAAAHDRMRAASQAAYRLAVDEYRAQLRVLLPLGADSRVLQLRCGWGAIALSLATCAASVVALDDRPDQLRFLAARRPAAPVAAPHGLRARVAAPLPFADTAFDAVVMIDALDRAGTGGWRGQRAALGEAYRVLRPGGSLLLGVPNRLGFGRAAGARGELPRTYWSYRGLLRRAGFANVAFYAPLPSHHEPFFILPLDRWRIVNHFVDGLFTAQDYRFKLEARGLGAAYQLAWRLWRVGRSLRLTWLARYVTPSYLIVAQR